MKCNKKNGCVLVFQIQVRAYMGWVNSQLKRRSGVRKIEDLQTDMHDGTALVTLVEIICMYPGVENSLNHPSPCRTNGL